MYRERKKETEREMKRERERRKNRWRERERKKERVTERENKREREQQSLISVLTLTSTDKNSFLLPSTVFDKKIMANKIIRKEKWNKIKN